MMQFVKAAYFHYVGVKVGDQNKRWASHICCNTYSVNIRCWMNNKELSLYFGIPMIGRGLTNHRDQGNRTEVIFCGPV